MCDSSKSLMLTEHKQLGISKGIEDPKNTIDPLTEKAGSRKLLESKDESTLK